MTHQDLLDSIHALELDLKSLGFRKWLRSQSEDDRKQMIYLSAEVARYRNSLERDRIRIINNQLQHLADDLTKAFENIETLTEELQDFAATLESVKAVVGLIARVVAVAA